MNPQFGTSIRRGALIASVLLATCLPTSRPVQAQSQQVTLSGPLRYQVFAGSPRLNRKVTGDVVRRVNGVPAEPVDSFVYDGDGSTQIDGELVMEVDPVREVGFVRASWTDEHGEWLFMQTRFVHPEHSSGVRLGGSIQDVQSILNEGITQNVYLHGDTQAGMPVLPTLFNFLAAWGPVDVSLNGQPFENPFELPAPQWLSHLMVAEGVRHPDGTVRNKIGEIYEPSRDATQGTVEPGDLELHLVFHDERFPRTQNRPSMFSFFYHLVFEDVVIQIVEAREPIVLDDGLLTGIEDPPRRERDRRTQRRP